jgi:NDP-sugar pyrophosphorylase family protein
MRDYDSSLPKALLPVAGQPFAHWQLTWLASEGIDVVYSIGYKGDMIREYVGDGRRWGTSVRYVEETQGLLGTGGAVRLAVDEATLGDRFFILYGDAYLRIDFGEIDRLFLRQGLGATMTVFENRGQWDQSNVVFEDGVVTEYAKGHADPSSAMRYIDYGLSEVDRALVEERIPSGVRTDLADFFTQLSREGRLGGFEATERFFEVGSPEGLRDLEAFLSARGDAG